MMMDVSGRHLGDRLPAWLPEPGRAFFDNLIAGQARILEESAVRALVDASFPEETLAPLTSDQLGALRADVFQRWLGVYGVPNQRWQALGGESVFLWRGSERELVTRLVEQRRGSSDYHTLLVGELAMQMREKHGFSCLSPGERALLFTSPEVWTFTQIATFGSAADGAVTLALQNGTRHLVADHNHEARGHRFFGPKHYGFTRDSFRGLLADIRSWQGKSDSGLIRGLDLGGSNGLAAYEAECLDPAVEFTSTTLDLEPAFWPIRGGHLLSCGEAVPARFRMHFDLVLSSVAIRWMRYPAIALDNIVESLTLGGVAYLEFATDNDWQKNEEELRAGIQQVYAQLQEMGGVEVLPRADDDCTLLRFRKTSRTSG